MFFPGLTNTLNKQTARSAFSAKTPATTPGYDEPLLTRKEIAAYLHISLVTIHDWMNKGLPHIKKGSRVLFLKSEVLEAIKTHPARRR